MMMVILFKVEIRKKINAVAEKIKQEKTKKTPMKEIKSNIVQSERVEDETKGDYFYYFAIVSSKTSLNSKSWNIWAHYFSGDGNHFKAFVPKHFK